MIYTNQPYIETKKLSPSLIGTALKHGIKKEVIEAVRVSKEISNLSPQIQIAIIDRAIKESKFVSKQPYLMDFLFYNDLEIAWEIHWLKEAKKPMPILYLWLDHEAFPICKSA